MIGRILSWLSRKAAPGGAASYSASGGYAVDAYRRQREPSQRELLQELKSTAWACATINAASCASHQPKLYVETEKGQPSPKCGTKPISRKARKEMEGSSKVQVEEVTDHPILTLFEQVNPYLNAFDLWELTTLYQEVLGQAYWLLEFGPMSIPNAIWPLPPQCVTPHRDSNSSNLVDYYEYRDGGAGQRFTPEEVIYFSYPDPRDPYVKGLSPLRAAFEQVQLASEFAAFKNSKFRNHALPDAILSPEEVIGEEERDRLEMQWNQKMRRGGAGKVIVGESKLHVQLLAHSMGDISALADMKATKEDIALAFGVPQPFVSGNTNMANLLASREQHAALALRPRIRRRDEKLNERLIPLFDDSGRLFLWTEDPVPEDKEFAMRRRNSAFQLGYVTVNEAREEIDLPPVAGGDVFRPQKSEANEVPEPKPDSGIEPQRDGDNDGETNEAAKAQLPGRGSGRAFLHNGQVGAD